MTSKGRPVLSLKTHTSGAQPPGATLLEGPHGDREGERSLGPQPPQFPSQGPGFLVRSSQDDPGHMHPVTAASREALTLPKP